MKAAKRKPSAKPPATPGRADFGARLTPAQRAKYPQTVFDEINAGIDRYAPR